MTTQGSTFVLVHGAWHSSETWDRLVISLEKAGHKVCTLDLPGAGQYAKSPPSFSRRPLDLAAFASEVSPNAGVTQEQRTTAVMNLVRRLMPTEASDVILVGHSLGGVTISAVAEAMPQRIRALVYLCAYLVPPGMPTAAVRQHPTMAASAVPGLQLANPMEIGAIRIDPLSEDPEYRERMRQAFAGDLSAADFALDLAHMHCDEPVHPVRVLSPLTPERGGAVPRHYVRTRYDQAMPIGAQDFMISAADAALSGTTGIFTLDSSHAVHRAHPDSVAEILKEVAS